MSGPRRADSLNHLAVTAGVAAAGPRLPARPNRGATARQRRLGNPPAYPLRSVLTPLLALFLAAGAASCSSRISPTVVESSPNTPVIDLSGWSFREQGAVRLFENTWEFYWAELYAPDDFSASRAGETTIRPPILVTGGRAWNGLVVNGSPLGPDGYATYRTTLLLPEAGGLYGLYIPNMDSAYSFWVNGELLAQNGMVGKTAEEYRPQRLPAMFHVHAHEKELELVIQIANFTHKWGGLSNNIYIGLPAHIQLFIDTLYNTVLFLSGAILIMAVYHFFLFLNRRKDRASLWFALFCLSVLLWYLFNGDYLFFRIFPDFPLAPGIRLQYLSLAGILPFFLLFFNSAYPDSLNRRFIRFLAAAGFLFMALPLLTPVKFFTAHTLVPFYIFVLLNSILAMIILIRALARKRQGSWISLAGFLVLFAAAVYDIAADRKIILGSSLGPFAPQGLFVFILCQSFILAGRFSAAYEMLDDLSRNLEQKVRRRTAELAKARERIYEREKLAAVGALVGGVSHEILNPLSGISGPLLILRREIESSDLRENDTVRKHLGYIQENVEQISAAVNNLRTLVKERELPRKPIQILPVTRRVVEEYAGNGPGIAGRGIDIDIPDGAEVMGDEGVLFQILTNLLSNALDAVDGGGNISIRYDQDESGRAIVVADSGRGMTREEAAMAMDPFFTTKAASGGTGLGLYLVEKLAGSLGWRVSISSRKGEGTEVRIEVP